VNSVEAQDLRNSIIDVEHSIGLLNEVVVENTATFYSSKSAIEDLDEKFSKYNQGVDFGSKVIAASIPTITTIGKISYYLTTADALLAPILVSIGAGYVAAYFFFQAYARTYKEEIFGSKKEYNMSKFLLKAHKKNNKESSERLNQINAALKEIEEYKDYLYKLQDEQKKEKEGNTIGKIKG
jgi:hypothetical protein